MIERLREIEPSALTAFTEDLKKELLARVSDKISHLESSLAVAELTVVLHYLMNTPEDVLKNSPERAQNFFKVPKVVE